MIHCRFDSVAELVRRSIYYRHNNILFHGGQRWNLRRHHHIPDDTLEGNYSIELALYREYLEEVFGHNEYIKNDGDPYRIIMLDTAIKDLQDLIKSGKAFVQFLGVTIDMTHLRSDFCYIIYINSEDYFFRNKPKKNDETTKLTWPEIAKFKRHIDTQNTERNGGRILQNSSAALWYLAMKDETVKNLAEQDG